MSEDAFKDAHFSIRAGVYLGSLIVNRKKELREIIKSSQKELDKLEISHEMLGELYEMAEPEIKRRTEKGKG